MAILDVRTWPRGDVPGLGTDEDVGLIRGVDCNTPRLNRINSILIPPSCSFFSRSLSAKNSRVKRAEPWSNLMMGDRLGSIPGCAK
jgi:hypothetical protein